MIGLRSGILVVALACSCLALDGRRMASAQSFDGQPPLTVVSWGGAFTKSQMLAFIRPYREATGRWVNVEDYVGGLAEIRDQVLSLNVKWDVVSLELPDAVQGCQEGLLEPMDASILPPAPDGTPATEDFFDIALQDCAIGYNIWATVVAYDTTQFGDQPPSSLADFFDLDRFPGARGLQMRPQVNLEWALLADGVPADQVYDMLSTEDGLDRAFSVLNRIRSDVVWWQRGSEPPLLLSSGRVAMSSAWNGRIFEAVRDRGADLDIVWDGQVWNMDAWGIPKGSDKRDEALAFVAFAADSQRLAEQASYVAYGPARRSATALVKDDVKAHLPTAEGRRESAFQIDYLWWAERQLELESRFQAWLTPAERISVRRDGH